MLEKSIRKTWPWHALFIASLSLGLHLTQDGVATWDSLQHWIRGNWILSRFGLPSGGTESDIYDVLKWYGPLWEIVLGLFTWILSPILRDPTWIRHSLTFALWPLTLAGCAVLIVGAGYSRLTAAVCIALLLSAIRLSGHALLNVTDAPFAMAYILSALGIWTIFTREADGGARWKTRTLVGLAAISLAPYWIRPPVLLPFVLVLALFFVTSGPRLRRIGISFAAAYLLTLAIWPPLWDAFPIGWGKAIQQFSKFPWTGDVRAFGVTYPSTDLPWFYPLLWLPVVITPCGLLALAGGVFGNLRRETSEARSFALLLPIRGGLRNELTLKRWLLFFTVASWAAVLVARPVLYDEDRHLLFLFPPLLIWAGLGFERFRPVIRMGVIAACLIGAALAHHEWGRYSYVYKSSWAGDRSAGRFMGDYWGLCVQNIVRRIPSNVPAGSEVAAGGLWEAAGIQMDRLGIRPSYSLRSSPSGKRPYYRIQINRVGWLEDARRDVERGEAKVLDREIMPLGEDACWLLEYR